MITVHRRAFLRFSSMMKGLRCNHNERKRYSKAQCWAGKPQPNLQKPNQHHNYFPLSTTVNTSVPPVCPYKSGLYISSAYSGGMTNLPGVTTRTR